MVDNRFKYGKMIAIFQLTLNPPEDSGTSKAECYLIIIVLRRPLVLSKKSMFLKVENSLMPLYVTVGGQCHMGIALVGHMLSGFGRS